MSYSNTTSLTRADMDFAVRCPLVRHWRLLSGFCPSTRTFAPRFLQTSPHDDSPCALLALHLHQVGQGTFTPKLLSMPSTQRSRRAADASRAPWVADVFALSSSLWAIRGTPQ